MTKRKRKSGGPPIDADSIGQKRARQSEDGSGNSAPITSQSVSYGRVDPTYGQRSAIPGLDEYSATGTGSDPAGGDSEVECSIDEEALSYLRSVREEASTIPTLLVAPRGSVTARGEVEHDAEGEGVDRGIYEDGVGDSRGWYEDGAYTAAPASPPPSGSGVSDVGDGGGRNPQEAYYEALLGRFEALREKLRQVPPRHAVERLGPDHGSYMSASVKDYKSWLWRLRNTEPKPAQLAGMDKDTVLRLLRIVGGCKRGFLSVNTLVGEEGGMARRRVSAWVWGLLARLPGRGELVSEEVGVVRELGKRAVWLGVEMKGVDMAGLQAQMEDGREEGEGEGLGDEEVVGVEVDGEDEELELQEDESGFTNGDDSISRNQHHGASSPVRQNSSFSLDPDTPPIIGPISPESLRGQSSRHLNSISNGDDPDTLNGKEKEQQQQEEEDEEEEEALTAARTRLLARLSSPTAQPTSTDAAASEDGEWSGDDNGAGRNADEAAAAEGRDEEEEPEGDRASGVQAAKTLLDMIITVAGEAYGQRDLLEFREVWE